MCVIVQLQVFGSVDRGLLPCGLLKVGCCEDTCFAGSVTEDDATFLRGLNVTLVETPDPVSDSNKVELCIVKDVPVLSCQL